MRVQYFLTYAMQGTVLPYAPVFFRRAGLTETQIGYVYAIYSLAFILSPVLVTFAADTRMDPRRLMTLALSAGGAGLLALGLVHGVGPLLAVWSVHCLAAVPLMPLQDGICLSLQRRLQERGEPCRPYHRIRVWGTIGFIVPSLLLFGLLHVGMPVGGVLMSGAAFAALAALQALFLDDPRAPSAPPGQTGVPVPAQTIPGDRSRPRLPTLEAAGALLRPNLFVLCVAAFLGQMASTVLGAFYPIYLTEKVGLADEWIGLIANLGVVVEIFFVAGCGWLGGRLGVKGVMAVGLACTAARMGLLYASTTTVVAVATQLFHGIQVVALGVVPQTFVDRYAADRWRHSMQGVFVMLMGCGRVAGSLTGGPVAARGVQGAFGCGALLCLAGVVLMLLAFKERDVASAAAPPETACPADDVRFTPALPGGAETTG